ncbi:MBL fold metallo-hydrolase [Phocaeicola abscessus]|uniref:MBL fold metallo-hydrolase n=1 Tax=Phocaeicola abscessus TaxID=555313 RepID=UPI000385A7EC|nr:MBL fold metallo-hydrolase [Phocaeicola abscessus]EPT34659.1 beta-lactamase family protein [Bacteroidetes bacterium oral taxon 272 str. F0290]
MKITILGTGTSTGVPEVGCTCPVCTSKDSHDNRLRCSGIIDVNGVRILIDCGPDFREQMIRLNDFRAIDAVLLTHEHYDHVGGIDDLRPWGRLRDIPLYADHRTYAHLRQRIPYCFGDRLYPGVPKITLTEIFPDIPFKVSSVSGAEAEILPLLVMHGEMPILGYRIGKMAWITDMLAMPEEEYEKLHGLDLLIMNALHWAAHPAHQNLEQALQNARRIGAEETYFIHMSHKMGLHAVIDEQLPPHIHLAYDGLTLEKPDLRYMRR